MENTFLTQIRSSFTSGQTLSKGNVIDLVESPTDATLAVIFFRCNGTWAVLPRVEYEGTIFNPPQIDESVRRAIRFPKGATEYGSTAELFSKLSAECTKHFAFSESSAAITAAWVISTWLPEAFLAPPTLSIMSADIGAGMNFARFLAAIARRAIAISELTPAVAIGVNPTLIIVDCGLGKKLRARWRIGTFRNVYVPDRAGRLEQFVISKAILAESPEANGAWGDDTLQVTLLRTDELSPISNPELDALAEEFQPKLQLFRLRRLSAQLPKRNPRCPVEFAGSGLGRELYALFADEPAAAKLLLPALEQQQEASIRRSAVDPFAVIVEVIWGPVHSGQTISTSEICGRANALLHSRGERTSFTAKEIGWKLSSLELPRRRTANAMVLRDSDEVRSRLHDLARRFALKLPKMKDCQQCVIGK